MVETLDITKDHCPMTFVKVKLALARLATGDVLDVALTGAEPLENVPRAAQEEGNRVREIVERDGAIHVLIEKGPLTT